MKGRLFLLVVSLFLLLNSCQKEGVHELFGVPSRKPFYEQIPFGMVFIKQGSFKMGPSDEMVNGEGNATKTVSVQSFWMDDTEITNNEYREFVYWVRDSIARQMLGESFPEYLITETRKGEMLDEPRLNWNDRIEWKNPDYQAALEGLYVPEQERFFHKKEIDTRKLFYEYYWIDYQQAAKRSNSYNYKTQSYEGSVVNQQGERSAIQNRSSFIMHESTPVYPDTLVWIRDYTFSYNEPLTRNYFWHPSFDDYPVVGVTWAQAKAFCHWRTKRLNDFQEAIKVPEVFDYRLPTEAEWEYAARGGKFGNLYPWGSYYTRNQQGCFLANFKPLRGNYIADSRTMVTAMRTGSFSPNNFGLYDMAGNVAEWTVNAFDESSYEVSGDFNPMYQYNALLEDDPVLKRKVIRGGSWKDVAYYIQVSTRSFEYQDSAKSYVGFRCVRTAFKEDIPK
jgi:formylglycine-generating enzyme required for sulfatase activity